ncbi:Cadherin-like beta sandwich domain containing protein [uncultured Caudovirales phage]|uniref:Cadherin-like beta sandwich domain containing protein n=1 Tax=uncultured Caudovirales phage TaxID=2100421 RepID=A0A6J5KTH7_9CAUD|nr:Cadherin-like beta sandwich domain containing protein [uncultured Caudovirales phage]
MTASVSNIPVSVDYTNRDYYSIRNQLIQRIQARVPEWTGNDSSDFGVALVEAFSYMGDIVNYYIDRVANEAFILTATQRQSIIDIAKSYGYSPASYRAASTTLQFTNSSSSNVVIPAATQVTADVIFNDTVSQVIFTTTQDVTVLAGNSNTVAANHGEDVSTRSENLPDPLDPNDIAGELIAVSDGTPDQLYPLIENQVVEGSVTVYVQNGDVYELWNQVVHLADYGPNEAVYSVSTDADNYLFINFGDGISGAIPTLHSSIKAVYTVGGGVNGNISTNLVNTIRKVPGLTSSQVSALNSAVAVTNTAVGVGGSDPEDNDTIRANAPLALNALNRAVTLTDFGHLALNVTSTGKANATAAVWNSVTLYVAPKRNNGDGDLFPGFSDDPSSGGVLTAEWYALQTAVAAFLADKTQIGVSLTVSPPSYVPVSMSIQFTKLPQYTSAQVSQNIKSAIVNGFSYNFTNFQDVINPEEFEFQLKQVEGVANVKVNQVYRSGATAARTILIGAPNELFVFQEADIAVTELSSDSSLSALTASAGTLSPTFASAFLNYNLPVPNGTTSVTITPTHTNSGATMTVNGTATTGTGVSVTTAVGTTVISVVVVAADGTTITSYKVTVTRVS